MIQRVLLVDDDPDIRMVGGLALGVGGWEVHVAASGEEGLRMAADLRPDVILLDVMMPTMDGPTTLDRLRRNAATRDIPVVFCTAKAQRHEVEYYASLGAAGVIAKPFDAMTLHVEVRDLLRREA